MESGFTGAMREFHRKRRLGVCKQHWFSWTVLIREAIRFARGDGGGAFDSVSSRAVSYLCQKSINHRSILRLFVGLMLFSTL